MPTGMHVKTGLALLIACLPWDGVTAEAATAVVYSACPVSGLTASGSTVNLKGNCVIAGNLSLSGTATLTMTTGSLTVKGNIILNDAAKLTLTGSKLILPQSRSNQYVIELNGDSQLTLKTSTLVTNLTKGNNFYMSLEGNDDSVASFENSQLETSTGSWLLGNFRGRSRLTLINARDLPTEVYPYDAAEIYISKGSSIASVWLDFTTGTRGTVNIPELNAEGGFSFRFGPSTGIAYSVEIDGSRTRLGINSHPGSAITVNGSGTASTRDADIVFGYYLKNNTAIVKLDRLDVGRDITRRFTDQKRYLQLNHVNLNPFAWQVYVSESNGFPVQITNSKINELAALHNGYVKVSSSIVQLAILGAVAPGSKLEIANTQIWAQAIEAHNGGSISIRDSALHGNLITASGTGSKITMTRVHEERNGIPPQSCANIGLYPPNRNGIPLCHPMNALYRCSQVVKSAGATITASPALTCPAL